jgi:putative addiction module component (TIGR02574 family)
VKHVAEGDLAPPLTDEQKAELDRRIADHGANPNDVASWEDVKASALARMRPTNP